MQKSKEQLNINKRKKPKIFWNFFILFLFIVAGSSLFFSKEVFAYTIWKNKYSSFGPGNERIVSMAVFNGVLYLGTYNERGADVYKEKSDGDFQKVLDFDGESGNIAVSSMMVFKDRLYLGILNYSATGAQIWRSTNSSPENNGDWEISAIAGFPVPNGFGDANNRRITSFEILGNYLYVSTYNSVNGTEVWRSFNGIGDWIKVNVDGFGNSDNIDAHLKVFSGWLWAGTTRWTSNGAFVYRYNDAASGGTAWGLFNNAGFGDNNNKKIILEGFGTTLFAGTENWTGLQLWRCPSYCNNLNNWQKVLGTSFGGGNIEATVLHTYRYENFQQRLILGTRKANSSDDIGMIWESRDGLSWSGELAVRASQVLGNSDTNDLAVWSLISKNQPQDNHLYAGIAGNSNNAELWRRNWKPILNLSTPSQQTDGSGKVNFNFGIDDYDGDTLAAQVLGSPNCPPTEFSTRVYLAEMTSTSGVNPTVVNGQNFQLGNLITTANSGGYTISGKWYSKIDEPNTYSTNTCLKITLDDKFYFVPGEAWESKDVGNTPPFTLDNVRPNPPTLNAVISPTKNTPQEISGTKDANSSVILNENTVVPINAHTIWSYSLRLLEGINNIKLNSKDYYGNASRSVFSSITLDQRAPVCSVYPTSGTYAGEIEVKIEANDNLDPDPYIFYTTDGTEPTSSSPKSKDKKTLTFDEDTTLKFFCRDWVGNKTSTTTREYKIIPPQITLTKSAATSFGGQYPVLSLTTFDVLLPRPEKAWQNIFAILFSLRDFLISQTEKVNLSPEILLVFLRGLSIVILGLTLIYLLLVFDLEWRKFSKIRGIKNLKETEKNFSFLAMMKTRYSRLAYVLPAVLIFVVFIHLLLGFALIAQNLKVKPKETITYTLAYQNIQKKKATDVKIFDPLPNYVDYLDGGNLKNNRVEFDIGTVLGNSSGAVQFRVRVKETAPHQGLIENKAKGTYGPEKVSFESNTTIHEVEATGKISGYIFYDSNANKLKDGGESGISGAKSLLYRDTDNNEKFDEQKDYLSKTTNTDSSGYYEFKNASAGTYFVKSKAPSENYQSTSSSDYQIVKLATSLDIISNINFGYLSVEPTPTTTVSPTPPTTTVSPTPPTPTVFPTLTISPTITPTPTAAITPSPTPFIKKITKPIKKTTEKIQETLPKILPEKLTEIIQPPQAQKTTKNFSPLLATLPILNLFFAFPSSIFGQFLRYLFQIFTEPFLYFGKKTRRNWGVVYDSLTKQPVDLATVRLYEKASRRLLESKVTDFEGRYIFIVDLGKEYYLEVKHKDYLFPSKILSKLKRDSDFNNLYFGEVIATGPISDIRKEEKGIIAFNIPVDPKPGMIQSPDLPRRPIYSKIKTKEDFVKISEKEKKKENQKIFLALTLRRLNYVIGFLGPILAFISLILVPSLLTLVFFIIHLILLAIFLKLSRGKKVLPWGKTYELKTKEGLPKTLVRLFDEKYGRLLAVTVTKSEGRYSFLTGREQYIIIPHRTNYIFPQKHIKLKPTRERLVKEDLGMKKIK